MVLASLSVAAIIGSGHGAPWPLAAVGALIVAAAIVLLVFAPPSAAETGQVVRPGLERPAARRVVSRPLVVLALGRLERR